MNNKIKTQIFIKGKVFCPLTSKEQSLNKCFVCSNYKSIGANKDCTHANIKCKYG